MPIMTSQMMIVETQIAQSKETEEVETRRYENMGLDISVVKKVEIWGFRAGSYSGFNEFRRKLAKVTSMVIDNMEGFGGNLAWDGDEPFYALLNHSDCDGSINREQAIVLLEDFKRFKNEISAVKDDQFIESCADWVLALKLIAEDDDNNRELIFG